MCGIKYRSESTHTFLVTRPQPWKKWTACSGEMRAWKVIKCWVIVRMTLMIYKIGIVVRNGACDKLSKTSVTRRRHTLWTAHSYYINIDCKEFYHFEWRIFLFTVESIAVDVGIAHWNGAAMRDRRDIIMCEYRIQLQPLEMVNVDVDVHWNRCSMLFTMQHTHTHTQWWLTVTSTNARR